MLMLDRSAMMHASRAGPSGWPCDLKVWCCLGHVLVCPQGPAFDLKKGSPMYWSFCVLADRKKTLHVYVFLLPESMVVAIGQ